MDIYLDCDNGVSGDMLVAALREVSKTPKIEVKIKEVPDHGRHLHQVLEGIEAVSFSNLDDIKADEEAEAKVLANQIYTVLGEAEAKVHEETLEGVHFHEVGRDEAISNVISFALALVRIKPDHLYVTKIMDGKGTTLCSHGEVEVPVPAVRAMMADCDLSFGTKEVYGERVTPTALAMIIGCGSLNVNKIPDNAKLIKEVYGSRDEKQTSGLKVYVE